MALHGSWNRTHKDGYKVVSLHWHADGKIEERDFLTGFLARTNDDDVIGRPVDVAEGPDGAVYVSDDYAGSIYRVAWNAAGGAVAARRRTGATAQQAPSSPAARRRAQPRSRAAQATLRAIRLRDVPREGARAGRHGDARRSRASRGGTTARRSPRTCARRTRRCPPSRSATQERSDLAAFLLASHP